ncbi:MAG: protein phosphatase 2C domain-containing protein [Chloroflexota bacterium]|nr:protein phosphatase 2C domain-containing protein [Chloroflexota bacterium]
MQPATGDSPDRCVETQQEGDTFTCATINDALSLRLLSVRCQESQAQALVNQDYVQMWVQRDGSSLCFCVCDGVGSSYRGDFAAHYLGTHLVKWLCALTPADLSLTASATHLHTDMLAWARDAHTHLLRLPLSPEMPALVGEVLAELRDSYGSGAVFFAGRIDCASWSTDLSVSHPTEAFFCWMGNVTARVFITADQYITLGGEEEQGGQWSTACGLRGSLTTWNIGLTTIERLIVHTDGLQAIGHTLANLDDAALQARVQQLLTLPGSDDMTVLDLRWLHKAAAGTGRG